MSLVSEKFYLEEEISKASLLKAKESFAELFAEAEEEDLMFIAETDEEIKKIKDVSQEVLSKYSDVVFIATGASYSIPKMIVDFANDSETNFHFLKNFSELQVNRVIKNLDPKKTFIIAISKSGESAEVLANFVKIHGWLQGELGKNQTSKQIVTVTEEKFSQLFCISETIGCINLNHPNVGGRFSALTVVGLLPALVVGFDIDKIIKAAKKISLTKIKQKQDLIYASAVNYQFIQNNFHPTVLSYGEYFAGFNEWYKQLIAESLGKDNKGIVPLISLGAYDQHIQLQLFLDGSEKLFFTLISINNIDSKKKINNATGLRSLDFLSGYTMQDLLIKNKQVVFDLLRSNKRNIRVLDIDSLNEEAIAEIIIMQLLELMILANILEINPFGQPAVESIKERIYEEIKND